MCTKVVCQSCQKTDIISIELSPNDTPMMFHTCRTCEHAWWVRVSDDEIVPVEDAFPMTDSFPAA